MAVVVAATNLRAPEVSMKPAWCRVRRPSSKNMVSASPKLSRLFLLICLLVGWQTKVELQAVQMALIEEKAKILQEIDNWRSTLEKLRAENGQLQVNLPLLNPSMVPSMVVFNTRTGHLFLKATAIRPEGTLAAACSAVAVFPLLTLSHLFLRLDHDPQL